MKIRNFFGSKLSTRLWGRRSLGKFPLINDIEWMTWKSNEASIYQHNQRKGIGLVINKAAYSIMQTIDLRNKTVLEIGAGDVLHLAHWQNIPREFVIVDISEAMIDLSNKSFTNSGVNVTSYKITKQEPLPLMSNSVDVVISFFSLEHIYPLDEHLNELHRVLKPGGVLVGGIPGEGGLAWGLGRLITSRRKVNKLKLFDYDKIIAWEHPNFADEIIDELDSIFLRKKIIFWPFRVHSIDLNLVIKFIYEKR